MEQVTLGQSDLRVTRLGFGAMGMSEFYGETDDTQSTKTLQRAVELGVNFFDTADMYGIGHNETLVGNALRPYRDQVVIATKFGIVRDVDPRNRRVDGSPAYVAQACDASLQRLGVDVIDLYYLHRVDPNTPIEETVGAMSRLVEQGKVRYLGLSEVSGDTLRRAHAVHPIAAVQSEYSLWTRDVDTVALPVMRELGVALVAYSPLGRGFLTGQYKSQSDFGDKDFRSFNPRFQGENFDQNLHIVEVVEQMAADKGCTPAQLALAWVLAQGEDMVPIPGTKREKYLEENVKALDVTLTPADLDALQGLGEIAAGTRYDANSMNSVNK